MPGRTYRSSSSENECSLAFQVVSSQSRSRVRYGRWASTSSSGSYQPSSRAIAGQPAISARFSAMPGRRSSSMRGIPSSTGKTAPQPVQRSPSAAPSSALRQTGQHMTSSGGITL